MHWQYLIWLFLGYNLKKLLSYLTSAPSICQNLIFLAKKKIFNVGPKLFYLGIFGAELKKATVLWFFYINNLKFFPTKFWSKIKILKFGTKIVLIGHFGLKFQKTNLDFEISIIELVNVLSSIQKQKHFKLGTKNTLLRYFVKLTKTTIKFLIGTFEFVKL